METSAKNATNVEQVFMAMAGSIKNRLVLSGGFDNTLLLAMICSINLSVSVFRGVRMASQPAMNNARPPTVQIRGQPVGQKTTCCSN